MSTPADVLQFWFGNFEPASLELGQNQSALWWGKSVTTDQTIRDRFADTLESAIRGELDAWTASPRHRLALVLVLDQMSRNLHRDTPAAFAQDEQARTLTLEAIQSGEHLQLGFYERVFLYLPLEHSESLPLQKQCVELFRSLRDSAPQALLPMGENFFNFAVQHHDIIERFGRFPHRNEILGRTSTPDEVEFLATPNSSF